VSLPKNAKLELANKSILITGCNGFLGQSLLQSLIIIYDDLHSLNLSSYHHITAIDNCITSQSCELSLPSYVKVIETNAITYDYSSLKSFDIVFHLAGLASPAQYKRFPLETIDVAVGLTRTLLEMSKKWSARFIFFSSSEIYGNPDPNFVPTPEDYNGYVSCRGPRACYDESKRMGETLCYVYNMYYGVDTRVIRPFNIYGPGMGRYDYRMVPNAIRSLVDLESIKIYGSGRQTRTFCYLTDAIQGILRVAILGVPGEVYNIGNTSPEISMFDLAHLIIKVTGVKVSVECIDYPPSYPQDEPMRRCPNLSKAYSTLDYKPIVTINSGIQSTYEWALSAYK